MGERDSDEIWAKSYAGMFAYYRQQVRPWYYWALSWLSPTHWRIQQFTEQCLMFSTVSTDAVNRSLPSHVESPVSTAQCSSSSSCAPSTVAGDKGRRRLG